jgi:hypothetical protein
MLTRTHFAVCHEVCSRTGELLAEATHQREATLSGLGELLELLGPPQLVMPQGEEVTGRATLRS